VSEAGEVLGERVLPEIAAYMEREGHARRGGIDRPATGPVLPQIAWLIYRLAQDGRDVLQVQADALRPRGLRVVAEVRMSDTHHGADADLRSIDRSALLASEWAVSHPEFAIRRSDGIPEPALSYAFPEVRERRLAIIEDLVTSRDIDGLSLNFNRWAKHFERDFAEEHAPTMVEFVGEVRATLDRVQRERGGRRMLLGARVPSTVSECLHVGVDVGALMARGCLDYLVVSTWNESRPDLRVEEFAELAKGTGCRVLGHIGDMIGGAWPGPPAAEERGPARNPAATGYASYLNTEDEARAVALNLRSWGAQGLGFWNLPCNLSPFAGQKWGSDPAQVERMVRWANAVADPERLTAGPRRYHFLPACKRDFADVRRNYAVVESMRSPAGGERVGTVIYLHEGVRGRRHAFPFRMADGRGGEPLRGSLRFRIFHCPEGADIDVDVNGLPVPGGLLTRTFDDSEPELPWTWFELRLQDSPPLRGDNELGLVWRSHERLAHVPYLEEFDVLVEAGGRT